MVAFPDPGKARMARWASDSDRNIDRIVKENLSKKRLHALDPEWVEELRAVSPG